VRWGDKVCPQCGGDLHADYADVALVCLKCGYHEPPSPRPQASAARLVALVDVRPRSRRLIEGLCAAHGCEVVPLPSAPSPHEEVALAGAELLIVEADRAGLAVALARRLREQAPAVPIAVVLTYWSESEIEARSTAEFVIHAPLREIEVNGVLEIVESYRGWLPSPLLAATYRSRVTSPEAGLPLLPGTGSPLAKTSNSRARAAS
jgi:hypothetical protein